MIGFHPGLLGEFAPGTVKGILIGAIQLAGRNFPCNILHWGSPLFFQNHLLIIINYQQSNCRGMTHDLTHSSISLRCFDVLKLNVDYMAFEDRLSINRFFF